MGPAYECSQPNSRNSHHVSFKSPLIVGLTAGLVVGLFCYQPDPRLALELWQLSIGAEKRPFLICIAETLIYIN